MKRGEEGFGVMEFGRVREKGGFVFEIEEDCVTTSEELSLFISIFVVQGSLSNPWLG